MDIFTSLRAVIAFVLRRSRAEREIEEELRAHLRIRAADLEYQGLSRAAAEPVAQTAAFAVCGFFLEEGNSRDEWLPAKYG
jgi:hypothetical protein